MLHWINSWNGLWASIDCKSGTSTDSVFSWMDSSWLLASNVCFSEFSDVDCFICDYGNVSLIDSSVLTNVEFE